MVLFCFGLYTFNEKGTQATFAIILAGCFIFFSKLPFVQWIHSLSTIQILFYCGLYIAICILYMVVKWTYNSFEMVSKYSEYREAWINAYNKTYPPGPSNPKITDIPEKNKSEFLFNASIHLNLKTNDLPPKISNHKSDLIFWACYWPFSFIFTLLNNPLKHLVNLVIRLMTNPLNRISQMMFQKFDKLQ
jgi:hypothetical protein